MNLRYYHIINLLLHKVKLPFQQKPIFPEYVAKLFQKLAEDNSKTFFCSLNRIIRSR